MSIVGQPPPRLRPSLLDARVGEEELSLDILSEVDEDETAYLSDEGDYDELCKKRKLTAAAASSEEEFHDVSESPPPTDQNHSSKQSCSPASNLDSSAAGAESASSQSIIPPSDTSKSFEMSPRSLELSWGGVSPRRMSITMRNLSYLASTPLKTINSRLLRDEEAGSRTAPARSLSPVGLTADLYMPPESVGSNESSSPIATKKRNTHSCSRQFPSGLRRQKKNKVDDGVIQPMRVANIPKIDSHGLSVAPLEAKMKAADSLQFQPGISKRTVEPLTFVFEDDSWDERLKLFSDLDLTAIVSDARHALEWLTANPNIEESEPWKVSLSHLILPDTGVFQELAAQLSYNMACDIVELKAAQYIQLQARWLKSVNASQLRKRLQQIWKQGSATDKALDAMKDACRLKADITEAQCNSMWQNLFGQHITSNTLLLTHSFVKVSKQQVHQSLL